MMLRSAPFPLQEYQRRLRILTLIRWLVIAGMILYGCLFWYWSFNVGRIRDGRYHPEWFYLFGFYQLAAEGYGMGPYLLGALSAISYAGLHYFRHLIRLGYPAFRAWHALRHAFCSRCRYDLSGLGNGATKCPECGSSIAPGRLATSFYRCLIKDSYIRNLGESIVLAGFLAVSYVTVVILSRRAWSFEVERECEIIRQVLVPTYWIPLVLGYAYLEATRPLRRMLGWKFWK